MSWSRDVEGYLATLARGRGARRPATLMEIWQSEWTRAGLDGPIHSYRTLHEARQELERAIENAAGTDILTYADRQGIDIDQADLDARLAATAALADTLPEDQLKDVRRRASQKAQAIERAAADTAGATYGLTGHATALLAGMAGLMADPMNLAINILTAPIGGPLRQPLMSYLGRQAAIGAGAQAAVEPIVQPQRAALGLEAGVGLAARNIAEAGIGSAGLAGLFRGAGAALRWAREGAGRVMEGRSAPEDVSPPSGRSDAPADSSAPSGAGPADIGPAAPDLPPQVVPEPLAAADYAPEDFDAAAMVAERDQLIDRASPSPEAARASATGIAAATEALEAGRPVTDAIPPAIAVKPAPPRGPITRDEQTWSLFEFIAIRGGIAREDPVFAGEIAALNAGKPRIYGAGPVFRSGKRRRNVAGEPRGGGMGLDAARESAIEAGYLPEGATLNDFLDLLDAEARGQKQYRLDYRGPERLTPAQREQVRAIVERDFDARMIEVEVHDVPQSVRARALKFMDEGDDPVTAVNRAFDEREAQREARRLARQPEEDDIPFWSQADLEKGLADARRDFAVAAEAGTAAPEDGRGVRGESPVLGPDRKRRKRSGGGGAGGDGDGPGQDQGPAGGAGGGRGGQDRAGPGAAGVDRALADYPLPDAVKTEPGKGGDQTLIPGVEPLEARVQPEQLRAPGTEPTDRPPAGRAARRKNLPAKKGGLFDEAALSQLDILDQLGDPALRADAERVLAEAGGDFKIVLDGREVSARDALAEAADDELAARALIDCLGGGAVDAGAAPPF